MKKRGDGVGSRFEVMGGRSQVPTDFLRRRSPVKIKCRGNSVVVDEWPPLDVPFFSRLSLAGESWESPQKQIKHPRKLSKRALSRVQ